MSRQMRKDFAPTRTKGTAQTSEVKWDFFKLKSVNVPKNTIQIKVKLLVRVHVVYSITLAHTSQAELFFKLKKGARGNLNPHVGFPLAQTTNKTTRRRQSAI